jgi:hypothetical protein
MDHVATCFDCSVCRRALAGADLQQYLHDAFVDTTWPSCPHHPNHPLGFSDGMWRCGKIATPFAPLGGLSVIKDPKQAE